MNEQDFVDLAKDCSKICDVLNAGTRGRNTGDLSPLVKSAIEDLDR